MKFIKSFVSIFDFLQCPKASMQVAFYSEGRSDWSNLKGLICHLLDETDLNVCYISSGLDDPGLAYQHDNFHAFYIGTGYLLNWWFENLNIRVMVMTTPDLNSFQIKRSRYQVHYIYVQHSLVSLHMAYRPGAFDHFDTVFCSAPHQVAELRAIESKEGLSPKHILRHGYSRLDQLIQRGVSKNVRHSRNQLSVLLAPSWGENCLIESGLAFDFIEKLLAHGCAVIFRPHPQTIKLYPEKVRRIIRAFSLNSRFTPDTSSDGLDSLTKADLMITDWSGAGLEFGLGLRKPILYIQTDKPKINNPDYTELGIEPLEISIREKLGSLMKPHDFLQLKDCSAYLSELNLGQEIIEIYNPGQSDAIGAEYIKELCVD